jgi:hypothetical protein
VSASLFVLAVVACNVAACVLTFQALKHAPLLVHALCTCVAFALRVCGRYVHVGEKQPTMHVDVYP